MEDVDLDELVVYRENPTSLDPSRQLDRCLGSVDGNGVVVTHER